MRILRQWLQAAITALVLCSVVAFAAETQEVKNDKVTARLENLEGGGQLATSVGTPHLILLLGEGALDVISKEGRRIRVEGKPGTVRFEPGGLGEIRNTGSSPMRFLLVDFNGQGSHEHWGRAGLSSHYRLLLENDYARVYDIFIPASSNEPQHTHKDRLVVCLSGAELTHLFPDGRMEVSSLKTGEVVWRKASTHIGQNHSANDFHALAVEPK